MTRTDSVMQDRHVIREDSAHLHAENEVAVTNLLLYKISWGAVFAGVVLALTTHLLLNMLGIGIGAATIDPGAAGDGTPSASAFAWSAAIWWIVAGIVAAYAGGFVASRVSGKSSHSTGGWHGLTSWALTTLTIFYMLSTTLGSIAGGAYNVVADTVSGVANVTGTVAQATGDMAQYAARNAEDIEPAAGNVVGEQNWNRFEQRIENEMGQMAGGLEVSEVRSAVMNVMSAAISQDQSAVQQAREEAVTIIAETQQISRFQAQQRLNTYEREVGAMYQDMSQQASQTMNTVGNQAAQTADTVANNVSQAALFSFLALMLGAIAAWFGGTAGTRQPV